MRVEFIKKITQYPEQFHPLAVIGAASVTAALLAQEAMGWCIELGIVVAAVFVMFAIFSPWFGLLTLFPMAFAIRPTPTSIGVQEGIFATLLVVVFIGALVRQLINRGVAEVFRPFGWLIITTSGLLLINYFVALSNHILFMDWLRGVVPFLFIFASIPVAILLKHNKKRQFWFGFSVAALITLMVGYVVIYYFANSLWKPYWTLNVDGELLRVSREVALNSHGTAQGPFLDRITMQVQRSTDAILPIGMVAGFIFAILSSCKQMTILGMGLSLLSMTAILSTFTRSMLSTAILVISVFSLFILAYRKDKIWKMCLLFSCLIIAGIVFIFSTGIDGIWFGRMGGLYNSMGAILLELAGKLIDFIDKVVALIRKIPEFVGGSTNLPVAQPDIPVAQPDIPVAQPDIPVAQPDIPVAQPDIPVSQPDTPVPSAEKMDGNVSTRLDEYRIAWQMFMDHPLLGNGLGAKHEMRWETSEGQSLYQLVGYVHNWPLYWLMVSGVIGLCIYLVALIGPVFFEIRSLKTSENDIMIVRTVVLTMAIYGLFFAVFRLVTFNLLLAAAWGYIFSRKINSG